MSLTVASLSSGLQSFLWPNIQKSNSSAQPDQPSCIFDISLPEHTPVEQKTSMCITEPIKIFCFYVIKDILILKKTPVYEVKNKKYVSILTSNPIP